MTYPTSPQPPSPVRSTRRQPRQPRRRAISDIILDNLSSYPIIGKDQVFAISTNYSQGRQYIFPNLAQAIAELAVDLSQNSGIRIFDYPIFGRNREYIERAFQEDPEEFLEFIIATLRRLIGFKYEEIDEPIVLKYGDDGYGGDGGDDGYEGDEGDNEVDFEDVKQDILDVLEENASSEGPGGFVFSPNNPRTKREVVEGNLPQFFLNISMGDEYIDYAANNIISYLENGDTVKYTLSKLLDEMLELPIEARVKKIKVPRSLY